LSKAGNSIGILQPILPPKKILSKLIAIIQEKVVQKKAQLGKIGMLKISKNWMLEQHSLPVNLSVNGKGRFFRRFAFKED
jgi:hypothetical protein